MIVLDVACGAGHAAESLAGSVRRVIGIDLTRPLLALGGERLAGQGISNVLLQEADAEELPFVDDSFDIAFCRSSLHHFAHPETAVAEMLRVCRGGGRVVLLDIVPPDAAVRDRFDDVHRLIDPSHVRSFLEPELAALLPGGLEALTYADTFSLRLPIDVALTDQSEADTVRRLLREDMAGTGEPTGFDPVEEDGTTLVTFTTCVVHGTKPA
jgi:SAM-dependent methyltransferase